MNDYQNPFSLNTARIPVERIVDRADQIEFLNERVIHNRENVLITGSYGVGKTCLLRKFRAELPKPVAERTLLIEMEMRQITADSSDFLGNVLLKLLGTFWAEVLKRPSSELVRAVTSPIDVREYVLPHVKMVLEMYRMIRPQSVTAVLEEHNQVGLDKIIKAVKEEKVGKTIVRGDIIPDEFISLTTDLLSELRQKGFDRTIIFGDEANHIDPGLETEIIRRNFEVFSEGGVQFVLTARPEVVKEVPHLKEAFPAFLDVKPFAEATVLDDLLFVYSSGKSMPVFSKESRQMLWQVSAGNPTEIQRLCQSCFSNAVVRAKAGKPFEVDLECCVEALVNTYNFQLK